MIKLTAFAAFLAVVFLSGCHHRYQTYDDSYLTEYEEDDTTYWEDADQGTYPSALPADDAYETEDDISWQDSSSAVTMPTQGYYQQHYAVPQYNAYSSAYTPALRYSTSYRPYIAPPPSPAVRPPSFSAPYRPSMSAWRYSAPPVSAAIRTPPPVFIWPVRICPY